MEIRNESLSAERVILVHGLWMKGFELSYLGRRLRSCGFRVEYFRYPSWRGTLADAALRLRTKVEGGAEERVHLVGHSLGGIVIARMLELGSLPRLGRIVLLGSPLRGSSVASALAGFGLGRFILGPVACEGLVEKSPALPQGRDLLIIAGTLPLGVGVFFGLPAPHDGTVGAAETQVQGAQVLHVRASHMGMLISPTVAETLCSFLRAGVF